MRTSYVVAGFVLALLGGAPSADAAGVAYAYDVQGRVITATYGNGTTITYTYDTAGNITQQQVSCPSSGC